MHDLQGVSNRDTYKDADAMELTNNLSKYMHYNQPTSMQNSTYDHAMSQQPNTDNAEEFAFDTHRLAFFPIYFLLAF